jgi:hypothetical protein
MAFYPGVKRHPLTPLFVFLIPLASWVGRSLVVWLCGLANKDRVEGLGYASLRMACDQLMNELDELKIAFPAGVPAVPSPVTEPPRVILDATTAASIEFPKQVLEIADDMEREGPRWVLGDAYSELWRRVHRADETWMHFAPVDHVIADAYEAKRRLKGSDLDNREDLLSDLNEALGSLGKPGSAPDPYPMLDWLE